MYRIFRLGVLRRYLRANALRRGLLGGDKAWLAVFGVGLLARQVNKVLKRGEMPIVFSEKLEPGASYLITHLPDPSRRNRKAARS